MRILKLLLVSCISLTTAVSGQVGTLDSTYWDGGVLQFMPNNFNYGHVRDMTIDTDGRITFVGWMTDHHRDFAVSGRLEYNQSDSVFDLYAGGSQYSYPFIGQYIFGPGLHVTTGANNKTFIITGGGSLNTSSSLISINSSGQTAHTEDIATSGSDGPKVREEGRLFIPEKGGIRGLNDDLSAFYSFGQAGFTQPISHDSIYFESVSFHPQGYFLTCGYTIDNGVKSGFITRLNSNGDVDQSYANQGIQLLDEYVEGLIPVKIVCRGDGSSIILGNTDTCGYVMKFDDNGALDLSFGFGGFQKISPLVELEHIVLSELLVQGDSKIVVGGDRLRFNSSGIQLVNGHLFVRLNSSGNLDSGFGDNGISLVPSVDTVYPQNNRLSGMEFYENKIVFSINSYYYDQFTFAMLSNDVTVGIPEIRNKERVLMFPNPVESGTEITVTVAEDIRDLFLYDHFGQQLSHHRVDINPREPIKFTIPNLPSGVYLVKLQTQDTFETLRLMIN
ncbi:MAG: T9SS type A sorting domain-containing protein [Flavobacteriales bacterium]|nr:T9SS type A sorting domain-containing protein [Flavobacteriales bacterium]